MCCLPSLKAPVQIPSGENRVESSENCGKLGILKKLRCHYVWLSHLTPAMVGGALSQPALHCASQEALSCIANDFCRQISLIIQNQGTEIWSAWQTLSII
jgi:hypothetical protein